MADKDDRPDVQIFMALLERNLWRPTDSGRKVVLEWLHYVAQTSLSSCANASVAERRESFKAALAAEDTTTSKHPSQVVPKGHKKSAYAFRIWPDKVQALVTYDTARLNDPSLPWTVRNGRYMPCGLHTPRLTVVAVKDMKEVSQPGTYAYFFAELEQPGPTFFRGLPPEGFSMTRPKSVHRAQAGDRMTAQLQALADIFSDHERFIVGELQPFFETSSNLAKTPAWGIVDSAFLRHLTASIQRFSGRRWPTLEDCRRAIKEEQQRLCHYIETIRFNLHMSLADQLNPSEALHISMKP